VTQHEEELNVGTESSKERQKLAKLGLVLIRISYFYEVLG